ncbi:hypothetical protein ABTF80_21605, partial [Acinetobacter baumannii]
LRTRAGMPISPVVGKARRYKRRLTVQNLGDRRYCDSGGAFVPTYPGAPHTVFASDSRGKYRDGWPRRRARWKKKCN